MMTLEDFVDPSCALVGVKVSNKGQLLDALARAAAPLCSVGADSIRARLSAREDLGSTGLGQGFALPHARVEGLERAFGLVMKLARPIDYDSIDGAPVDLVFCLLIPSHAAAEQLGAMSMVARCMREGGRLEALRRAKTGDALRKALTSQIGT